MSRPLEAMVARVLAERGVEIVSIDASGARLRMGEVEPELSFDNLRRLVASSPDSEADLLVGRFVDTVLLQVEKALTRMRSDLPDLSCLQPRLLPAKVSNQGLAAPWVEALAEGALHLGLCLDDREAVRMLTPLDLPRWGLGVSEAKERAMENLRARSTAPPGAVPGRLFQLHACDGYDAVRLLLAHQWFPDSPGVFELVPSRDLLLGIALPDLDRLQPTVARIVPDWLKVQDAMEEIPYPLSPQLFWCSEGLLTTVPLRRLADGRLHLALPAEVGALLRPCDA